MSFGYRALFGLAVAISLLSLFNLNNSKQANEIVWASGSLKNSDIRSCFEVNANFFRLIRLELEKTPSDKMDFEMLDLLEEEWISGRRESSRKIWKIDQQIHSLVQSDLSFSELLFLFEKSFETRKEFEKSKAIGFVLLETLNPKSQKAIVAKLLMECSQHQRWAVEKKNSLKAKLDFFPSGKKKTKSQIHQHLPAKQEPPGVRGHSHPYEENWGRPGKKPLSDSQ